MIALRTLLASAFALASLPHSVFAQSQEQTLPAVVVTSTPFGGDETAQIIAPAKVLSGDELREKLGNSLGDTLSQELGVSASAFGAGASRPIIRGMEGPRIKILQNGMSVMDASSLSNDHAVIGEASTARQIEILRGPAALLYGSGAIGGIVNVVNDRIPTVLNSKPTGDAEIRYGTVDQMKSMSFAIDGAAGDIGLHIDGNLRDANDYKIPGNVNLNDPSQGSGRLANSFARANSIGFGSSTIQSWGYIGASIGVDDQRYGIPTAEKSFITLDQTRLDVAGLIKHPFEHFESFRFKLGRTDYKHSEKLADGTPATDFKNTANETRWELTHKPFAGWRGTFGLQTENSEFSALPAEDDHSHGHSHATVPVTKSESIAAFLVEERDFGSLRASAGMRIESVKRRPDAASGLTQRSFSLGSYSLGGLWTFTQGYGLGLTASVAQRAPAIEELYSNGAHESTATYDIGNASLRKETSHNIELSLQKTTGLLRWKTNVFQNHVKNFVYGRTDGVMVDDHGHPGGEFMERFWSQNDATIRGVEAEVSYNLRGSGISWRGFADTSRGTLSGAGNLPLQAATRFGAEVGYRDGNWRSGLKVMHAEKQDRLASFEHFVTPSYTQVDANLSYTQNHNSTPITWFAVIKNLLNEDIRLSTSVLREVAPLPGRNLIIGVRTSF